MFIDRVIRPCKNPLFYKFLMLLVKEFGYYFFDIFADKLLFFIPKNLCRIRRNIGYQPHILNIQIRLNNTATLMIQKLLNISHVDIF